MVQKERVSLEDYEQQWVDLVRNTHAMHIKSRRDLVLKMFDYRACVAVTGAEGGGKTSEMVGVMGELIDENREESTNYQLMTNVPFVRKRKRSREPIEKGAAEPVTIPGIHHTNTMADYVRNLVPVFTEDRLAMVELMIDEFGKLMVGTEANTKFGQSFQKYVAQHRHFRTGIVGVTPDWGSFPKFLRRTYFRATVVKHIYLTQVYRHKMAIKHPLTMFDITFSFTPYGWKATAPFRCEWNTPWSDLDVGQIGYDNFGGGSFSTGEVNGLEFDLAGYLAYVGDESRLLVERTQDYLGIQERHAQVAVAQVDMKEVSKAVVAYLLDARGKGRYVDDDGVVCVPVKVKGSKVKMILPLGVENLKRLVPDVNEHKIRRIVKDMPMTPDQGDPKTWKPDDTDQDDEPDDEGDDEDDDDPDDSGQ